MAIEVKHKFVSNKADAPDPTLVQPSDWNDTHEINLGPNSIIGRRSTFAGPAEELPLSQVSRIVGEVTDFAGVTIPSGWLLCYGQAVSRVTYASLFEAIGTTYGVGNGSSTFNVPDLRGRVIAGDDDMGGASANRLSFFGAVSKAIGGVFGAASHILTAAEMPRHGHTITDPGHVHGVIDPGHRHLFDQYNTRDLGEGIQDSVSSTGRNTQGTTTELTGISIANAKTNITIGENGGSDAHSNAQPTMIMNKIIYAGA